MNKKFKKNFYFILLLIIFIVAGIYTFNKNDLSFLARIRLKNVKKQAVCPQISINDSQVELPTITYSLNKIQSDLRNNYLQKNSNFNIKEVLTERKKLLLKLFLNDPKSAVSFLFDDAQRNYWQNSSSGCVEEMVDITGKTITFHSDDFNNKISHENYFLELENNKLIGLHPIGGFKKTPILQQSARVQGWMIDNEILFDGENPTGDNQEADISPMGGMSVQSTEGNTVLKGDKKLAVFLVNFNGQPALDVDKVDVNKYVFQKTGNYYIETSYGKISLTGDVFGTYYFDAGEQCKPREITDKLKEKIKDIDNYDYIMTFAPFSGCKSGEAIYAGIAFNNASYISTSALSNNSWGVIAHELGHNFGNGHATFINCGDKSIDNDLKQNCTIAEYGDAFDSMGMSEYKFQFNAQHRENVGWLTSEDIKAINFSGQYTINPIEKYIGLRALKIPYFGSDYFYIEYHQKLDSYSINPSEDSNIYKGALIHVSTNSLGDPSKTGLINPLPEKGETFTSQLIEGETFLDPQSKIQIDTVKADQSQLTVHVTVNKQDITLPTVSVVLNENSINVSGKVRFKANASDNSGIKKVEFYTYRDDILFSTDYTAPYQAVLDTTTFPNGREGVYAIAYDKSDPDYPNKKKSQIVWIDIYNEDKIYPVLEIKSPNYKKVKGPEVLFNVIGTDNAGFDDPFYMQIEDHTTGEVIYEFIYLDKDKYKKTIEIEFEKYLSNGDYTFFIGGQDLAGNFTIAKFDFSVGPKDDYTPPIVNLTSDSANKTVSGIIEFEAICTDESGIQKVKFYYSSNDRIFAESSAYPYITNLDTSFLANGQESVYAICYDDSDLENPNKSTSNNIAFKILNADSEFPSLSILEPKLNSESKAPIQFRISTKDNKGIQQPVMVNISKVGTKINFEKYVYFDEDNYKNDIILDFSVSLLRGDYNAQISVRDLVGNQTYKSVDFTVSSGIDSITIPSPETFELNIDKEIYLKKNEELFKNPGYYDPVQGKTQ